MQKVIAKTGMKQKYFTGERIVLALCRKLQKTRFPAERIEISIWMEICAVQPLIRDANVHHWYQRLQSRGWLIGDETSLQHSGDSH